MFWELYQISQINEANTKARKAENRVQVQRAHIDMLEARMEALALACQSMWELLRDRSKLTEEDLLEKMQEVDLRDGQADGRMSKEAAVCSYCDRKSPAKRKSCIYCGKPIGGNNGHAFNV